MRGGGNSTGTPTAAETSLTMLPAATPTTGSPQPTARPTSHDSGAFVIDGDDTSAVEAERASTISGRFHRVTDAAASGGAYEVTTGAGMTRSSDSALAFNLALTQGGTFYAWVLGRGTTAMLIVSGFTVTLEAVS